jgi:restriction endonuclease S subunit
MDLVKITPSEEWISLEFLYFLMRSREFKYHCLGLSNGTTVLHLNKNAIPSFELPLPNKEIVMLFSKQTTHLIKKVFENNKQIRTLSTLRDSLLPKLMSGEVRVKI